MFIPTNSIIAEQAALVQATQSGELDVTKAMKEAALNTDLRRTAIDIGMLERVSMYSFRREAIIEMQRAMGTELARTLANHIPDSGTVLTYDVTGISGLDVTALRLGEE